MLKVLGSLILLVLTGCAGADIVKAVDTPKKGGVIRYKNGNFVREKSRLIAITKIDEYCDGPFSIQKEEFNPDVLSFSSGDSYYTLDKDNYMFIHFTCSK